ncbi:hypothetical protein ACLCDV_11870 [Sphingobacterium sp. Lzh-3]|uniref:hypothetical protein n=1 Tax=unclassified Sphingobacterium TaxID=2609468 RepID=UPI0029550134|nr:hypothetical protein [Sphingobacterium sp. UGAL515B_05]WON94019.1 hypothetical protein OK025_22575 [Sphingobacterium sp. UGAL515B_05]
MKYPYLGISMVCAALASMADSKIVFAGEQLGVQHIEYVQINSDSLKVEQLATALRKMKPISSADFKTKFKPEINGFKLTEVTAFEDAETGSYATANYVKGEQNIYLMVTDGAGPGSDQVKLNLMNYIDLKSIEDLGTKLQVKPYKGWLASFDWSMFENDGLTSIQYLESNRFATVSSANQVAIEELENFLNSFSL